MTRLNDAGRSVATRVGPTKSSDWRVVLSDDLISAAKYREGGRWAYLSQGDMALLLLNRSFVAASKISRSIVSLGVADLIRAHSRDAEYYDLLLANSKFTKHLMTYLYATPFQGVVYPPVDIDVFHAARSAPTSDYVLAMARNSAEQNLSLIEDLARDVPVQLVGGASLTGTRVVGKVSDTALAGLYSNAAFLAFPNLSEPFGYAVAECLSAELRRWFSTRVDPLSLVSSGGADGW